MDRSFFYFSLNEFVSFVNNSGSVIDVVELGLEATFDGIYSELSVTDSEGSLLRIIPNSIVKTSLKITDPLGRLFVELLKPLKPKERTIIKVSGYTKLERFLLISRHLFLFNHFVLILPFNLYGAQIFTFEIMSMDNSNYIYFSETRETELKPIFSNTNFLHVTYQSPKPDYKDRGVFVDVYPTRLIALFHLFEGYALMLGSVALAVIILFDVLQTPVINSVIFTEFTAMALVGLTYSLIDLKTDFVLRRHVQAVLALLLLSAAIGILFSVLRIIL